MHPAKNDPADSPTNIGKREVPMASQPEQKQSWLLPMLGDVQFWIPFAVLIASIIFLRFVR